MTRMITEWGSVVLVLSAAVLVIVIDARDVGWAGMARVEVPANYANDANGEG
jgi:hypothetical protein